MTNSKKTICDSIISMSEAEAVEAIKAAGLRVRVRSRDTESYMGTCDMRQDRVNLKIVKDRVVGAYFG